MQIVIDPTSLEATASVLRGAADALGEVCARVSGLVDGVYAPPSVASYAESVTRAAASTIHSVIYELVDEAADLDRRAGCCCAGQPTSLPVPALVGVAFGGGAAISGASQVQMGSSVGSVAARGPGLPDSSVGAVAARGPGISMAAAPVAAAPVAAAAAPAPVSLQAVLGSASFGGGSPVGSGISMVYNPALTSITPQVGIGDFVPMDNPPVAAGVGGVPLRGGGSIMDTALHQQAVLMPWGLQPGGTLLGYAFGRIPS
jgi:hypothetical protein